MRRTIDEALIWLPLICATLYVIVCRTHDTLVLPLLGMVSPRLVSVVYVWDPDTLRFTYADPEAEEQVGYTPDELYDMTLPDVTGKPSATYRRIADLLIDCMVASVKTTGMVRHKGNRLWHPVMTRMSLLVTPETQPQILTEAREMTPTEVAAPPSVLSLP